MAPAPLPGPLIADCTLLCCSSMQAAHCCCWDLLLPWHGNSMQTRRVQKDIFCTPVAGTAGSTGIAARVRSRNMRPTDAQAYLGLRVCRAAAEGLAACCFTKDACWPAFRPCRRDMQCFCKLRGSLLLSLCCLTDNERFLASVQLLPQSIHAENMSGYKVIAALDISWGKKYFADTPENNKCYWVGASR